jgi:hypothetical protein
MSTEVLVSLDGIIGCGRTSFFIMTRLTIFLTEIYYNVYYKVEQGWVDYKIFVVRYSYSYFKNM